MTGRRHALCASPTGYLHIGGARTALFNWLYARHTGGKFLLRIEDTDRERSTQAAVKAILDGCAGSSSTGTASRSTSSPVPSATARWPRTAGAGKAYRCYLTPAELEAMQKAIAAERELAKPEKRPPRGPQTIQSPWRDRDPSEAPPGVKPVIRLKVPTKGETVINDHVLGRIVFQNNDLDDMVILRSDGTPVYNHAVVVDDHDMGITHVIRGADHLTNAGRQAQVYAAMGWAVPEFAHVPLILGPMAPSCPNARALQGSRPTAPWATCRRACATISPARLEPRRRGDLLHRADDRVVRHR